MTDKQFIQALTEENRLLKAQVADLEDKLNLVLSQLSAFSVKENSSNSSLAPSSDVVRKTGSLRKKSTRKSGGQPGHKGSNLKMVQTPDVVEVLEPSFCHRCGKGFEQASLQHQAKRQVIDVPLPAPVVTEYRQCAAQCSCGHRQLADFPLGVNASVQYGKNIEALVGYLSVNQYLPYKRMTEVLKDVFSVAMSQGTVDNLLNRLSSKASPVYEKVRQQVSRSTEAVGADETSCSVNGNNHWAWVWQTASFCYLTVSNNRGYATVKAHFPEGFPNATLSSDRWASHLKTTAVKHQICLAHLLRELNYLEAVEKHSFSIDLQALFRQAIKSKKKQARGAFAFDDGESGKLEHRLNHLLQQSICKDKHPKTAALQRSLIKLRQAVFPFLYDKALSADNNASERSIRNFKVKMKVSGLFKSGQNVHAKLKSISETVKKKQQNVWEVFVALANANPDNLFAE